MAAAYIAQRLVWPEHSLSGGQRLANRWCGPERSGRRNGSAGEGRRPWLVRRLRKEGKMKWLRGLMPWILVRTNLEEIMQRERRLINLPHGVRAWLWVLVLLSLAVNALPAGALPNAYVAVSGSNNSVK